MLPAFPTWPTLSQAQNTGAAPSGIMPAQDVATDFTWAHHSCQGSSLGQVQCRDGIPSAGTIWA